MANALVSDTTSSEQHENNLRGLKDRYQIQNSELDKTQRVAEYQLAMENAIKDSLHEGQLSAMYSGIDPTRVEDQQTNAFEEDELTKYYSNELQDLVGNVADMTRDQLGVQKIRMDHLIESLKTSDAREKDMLTKQFEISSAYLEKEYARKNKLSERVTQTMYDMSQQYMDYEALYSGFFKGNPIAMLGWKLGKGLVQASKKRKDDEKELVSRDVHRQEMAIQTEKDKRDMLHSDAIREGEYDDAERYYQGQLENNDIDNSLITNNSETNNNSTIDNIDNNNNTNDSLITNNSTIDNIDSNIDNIDNNINNIDNSLTQNSNIDNDINNSSLSRDSNIDNDVDDISMSGTLFSGDDENDPVFTKSVDSLELPDDENVADKVRGIEDERKDRKIQRKYYQQTQKWQEKLLKCVCPFANNPTKKGKNGFGIGGMGMGMGSGSGSSGGGFDSDDALTAGGVAGGAGLAWKYKDKIKKLFTKTPKPDLDADGKPKVADVDKDGKIKKSSKVDVDVEKPGIMKKIFTKRFAKYLGIGTAIASGVGATGVLLNELDPDSAMPNRNKKFDDPDEKFVPYEDKHKQEIIQQVSDDNVTALTTDVALSTGASMLPMLKAVPLLGAVLGGVGDAGMEYADGGSAGSSLVAGGGAIAGGMSGMTAGATIGAVGGPVGIAIGGLIGSIVGGIAGSGIATSFAGSSDKEKETNLINRNLEERGVIDVNDLLPWENSTISSPEKLSDLSMNELQALLNVDDFSDDDTQLIKETLEIKQKKRIKLSKESQSMVDNATPKITKETSSTTAQFGAGNQDEAMKRNNKKSLTGENMDIFRKGGEGLGQVSEQYESGGRGAGTISTGRGDPGGESYGTYQLASKTGTLQKYLDQSQYKEQLGGEINSKEFKENWKKLANENPDEFEADQHNFIYDTHYKPVVEAYKKETGFEGNVDEQAGLSNALWSQSVQHGLRGNKKIIKNSMSGLDENATEEDRIKALYESRGDYVSGLNMNSNTKQSVLNRYQNEVGDAVGLVGTKPSMDNSLIADNKSNVSEKLQGDLTTNAETVENIQNTKNEIVAQNEEKSQQPVVISNQVSNNSSGGGGGAIGSPQVGSARNTDSSLQRITDRYIGTSMS